METESRLFCLDLAALNRCSQVSMDSKREARTLRVGIGSSDLLVLVFNRDVLTSVLACPSSTVAAAVCSSSLSLELDRPDSCLAVLLCADKGFDLPADSALRPRNRCLRLVALTSLPIARRRVSGLSFVVDPI